ncbi:MAG: BatA domain-containing protein [Rubripirellula sp.]|nr:BatA domain-containing protein [Rubripirellula sp.]
MSLLAPLYFLGALAVGLPILFHMIRRQPKGQIEFSSLMFLRPTPPRLTRRSRLDNWFLLLLRALALTLLALAFSRPFLRNVSLSDAEVPGRRLMMVIDTSASMQRAGLWQQAVDAANDVIDDLQAADQLAIVSFDDFPQTQLSFDRGAELSPEQLKVTAKTIVADLAPSWRGSETGVALSFAGDIAVSYEIANRGNEVENSQGKSDDAISTSVTTGPAQMILISDMQVGSELESLQAYAWPKELRLDVRQVNASDRTNASATVLQPDPEADLSADRIRVRVTNSEDATDGQFSLRWDGIPPTNPGLQEFPVQVPPGQTRIVRMPQPPPGVTALVLNGDQHAFDNRHYLVSPEAEELDLWMLGPTKEDPRESLAYYLQRVPLSNAYRNVSARRVDPTTITTAPDPKKVRLIVLNQAVETALIEKLALYVQQGGRLLAVLSGDPSQLTSLTQTINQITESNLQVAEATVRDYVMFSRIDFNHPVFSSMADPKFNDFTKIRFWNHRTIGNVNQGWQVIANFDDGDPALLEYSLDNGSVMLMATGWQPSASQLAMSTKFIPFAFNLFESGGRGTASNNYVVGQLLDFKPSETASITTPSETRIAFRTPSDSKSIDQPGIYQFNEGDTRRNFAVNVTEAESATAPLSDDQLERFGVVLGDNVTTEEALDNQRQLRDRELESEQKLWQWLLVIALVLLAIETLLGMLWTRRGTGQLAEGGLG